jgi:membrane protease YdiL (CAAX protease family)
MSYALLVDTAISACLQAIVLGGIPLVAYLVFQRLRHKRTFAESAKRAGLQLGDRRYLAYAIVLALLGNILLVLVLRSRPLSLEPFTREGAAQRPFVGLGFSLPTIVLAFFNGAVQTGFPEELLFRGLIAGSLSRRLSLLWANISQAVIFFLPHLLILLVMPELWFILPIVFVGALTFGWLRIRSGSILGSTLMHATGNMTMASLVAITTVHQGNP